MKYIAIALLIFVTFACNTSSKEKVIHNDVIQSLAKYGVDQSPMDMIYLPVDYPKLKLQDDYKKTPISRVIYSRPQKNGRIIFGQVIPFDKPWRLGANESTEIEFFEEVIINNQVISPDRYVLYCIPNEKEWKIILNKNAHTWGLKVDTTQDYASITVPVEKLDQAQEIFTMEFAENADSSFLIIAWDHSIVYIPIQVKK